jgi:hypothetical protein
MIKLNEHIIINKQFTGIDSIYKLDVLFIYMDSDAVRIRYKVTPPCQLDGLNLFLSWKGYATDNFGTEYDSRGGACGISQDGEYTDGVISFLPLITKNISFLDVTMISERIDPEVQCQFRVLL